MEFKDYQKYKWFVTSSGKLVIGGKSAEQNEALLNKLKSSNKDYIIMHTHEPGSPFSAILAPIIKTSKSDIEQAAIFTASFSRAWKQGKSKANVDIFNLSQLYKSQSMKLGTWGVKDKINRIAVPLSLVLTIQKTHLRAVPEKAAKSKKAILLKIIPGKTDKIKMLPKLLELLNNKFSKEEILSALPAGGIEIIK